jgi:hypothetical protein
MKPLVIFLALILAGPALAQKPPDVILPNPPAPPVPTPTPASSFLLKPGVLYVVPSTGPVGVTSSPLGLVSVTPVTGPITMWGVFSDSKDGKPELRAYKEPNVYIVTATNPGSCELLIFRSTDVSTLIRQAITTGDPAPPDPTPVVDPLTATFKAAMAQDNAPPTVAATLAAIYRTVASTTVNDPSVTTYAMLVGKASAMQDAKVPPLTIQNLRVAISTELKARLGTSGQAAVDRTVAANAFNAIAKALEAIH